MIRYEKAGSNVGFFRVGYKHFAKFTDKDCNMGNNDLGLGRNTKTKT